MKKQEKKSEKKYTETFWLVVRVCRIHRWSRAHAKHRSATTGKRKMHALILLPPLPWKTCNQLTELLMLVSYMASRIAMRRMPYVPKSHCCFAVVAVCCSTNCCYQAKQQWEKLFFFFSNFIFARPVHASCTNYRGCHFVTDAAIVLPKWHSSVLH